MTLDSVRRTGLLARRVCGAGSGPAGLACDAVRRSRPRARAGTRGQRRVARAGDVRDAGPKPTPPPRADLARGRNMERIRSALATAARAFTEARRSGRDRERDARFRHQDARGRGQRQRGHVRGRALDRSQRKRSIRPRAGSRRATFAAHAAAPTRPKRSSATPSSRRSRRST